MTQRADVEGLVESAVQELGRLDVFVGPTADLDVDGWSAMMDVNLRGVLHGIAAALPVFRRQGHGDFITELDSSIDDPEARRAARAAMESFGMPPEAVARAIVFAIGQPRDVEIGDITIRPTRQG